MEFLDWDPLGTGPQESVFLRGGVLKLKFHEYGSSESAGKGNNSRTDCWMWLGAAHDQLLDRAQQEPRRRGRPAAAA